MLNYIVRELTNISSRSNIWSSRLGVWREANTVKTRMFRNVTQGLGTGRIIWMVVKHVSYIKGGMQVKGI